ncbi:MAG: conserved hypothetical rane protein [Paenibacillaceae bacterium]|jgi:drug/metabolite transporter (DMT)-like permease|nr:conserved hypothetical rane protein [Paenibacillaceae bacterium]
MNSSLTASTHPHQQHKTSPLFVWQLVATSLLWAGNFVAGKFTAGHMPAIALTELRYVIAVLVLLPYVWVKEGRLLPPRRAILSLIGMAATGVVLFNVFLFKALEYTTAANIGLLSALNPIAIALISFVIFGARLKLHQIFGMTVSFGGVLLVLTQGEWGRLLGLHFNSGDLFMLGAVAVWGVYTCIAQTALKHVTPLSATLWSGIFGLLLILPFNLHPIEWSNTTPGFWGAIVYIAVGATVIAMVLWNIGVGKVGGTRAGMYLNLNPVFTALLSFLLLDERMSVYQYIGTAVVITGMLIFTSRQAKQ